MAPLTPPARHIVRHRQHEQNPQPDKAGGDKQPGDATAGADVHEEEDDEHGLGRGDGEGDDFVEGAEVDEGNGDGEHQEGHEDGEYLIVNFEGGSVFSGRFGCWSGHHTPALIGVTDKGSGREKSRRYRQNASRGQRVQPA